MKQIALNKADCLLCAAPLAYHTSARPFTCALCGGEFVSEVSCEKGHFICDACHAAGANDLIERVCSQSSSVNPIELSIALMKHTAIKMHGPEHHFLVPAVLLCTYYNATGQAELKEKKLRVARQRAENVLGGFCGFYGACGACVGTGIYISVMTEATPLSTKNWGLANKMTSESLSAVAEIGGPRCCKRDTYLALQTAIAFTHEHFTVELDTQEPILCEFSHLNRECLLVDCQFHS